MRSYVAGWIVWGMVCLAAAAWSGCCLLQARQKRTLDRAALNTAIVWWLLIGWSAYLPKMDKFNLVWLAPLAVPLSNLFTAGLPWGVGLVGLVVVYVELLYWVTYLV